MKEIKIHVKDSKYRFLLELLRSLDFVTVSEEKESTLENIERGFKEMSKYKKGKEGTSLKDFLSDV